MTIVSIRNPCRRCGKLSTRIARWRTADGDLVKAIICTKCLSHKSLRLLQRIGQSPAPPLGRGDWREVRMGDPMPQTDPTARRCISGIANCGWASSWFTCEKCHRKVCYCQGAYDENPEMCADCWSQQQRAAERAAKGGG
jgi:hypothetical protein